MRKKFEDNKGLIRSRKSKKDRKYNNKRKKKTKRKNNVLQTIRPTTKDWATRTPLKSGGKLRYSWWVSSSCSTSDTHRVTLVRNQVINHEWGKNRIVITTKETLPWSFVSLITSTWSLGTFGSVPTLLEANLYPGRDRRGRDRMVSGFTTKCALMPITTKVESSNPVHGELYSVQHYVIQFVSTSRWFSPGTPVSSTNI